MGVDDGPFLLSISLIEGEVVSTLAFMQQDQTYNTVLLEDVGMRGPQIGSGMFSQGFRGGRADEVKRTFSVWTKSYPSTDFTKRWGCFIDMDVNVGILEKANGKTPELSFGVNRAFRC